MINFSQLFVTALSVCVLAICLVYPDEGAVEDENVAESERGGEKAHLARARVGIILIMEII